ncbi:MAG: hypothetical protein Fur0037_22620 [Planctomycetota bacterium]
MARLLLIGSDHHEGPLSALGALRSAHDAVLARLVHLRRNGRCAGAALIDTCNRFEVVVDLGEQGGNGAEIQEAVFGGLPLVPMHVHEDEAAALHLLRVATGLESLVRGEDQIAGQIARGFQEATEMDLVSKLLVRLWSRVSASARHLRGKRPADEAPRSVAELAARIACGAGKDIAVIGAGATARVAMEALRKLGAERIWVYNRTESRAKALASHFSAESGSLDDFLASPPDARALVLAINGRELSLPTEAMPGLRAVVDISQPSVLDARTRARRDLAVYDLDLLAREAGSEARRIEDWLREAHEMACGAASRIWAEVGQKRKGGDRLGHLVDLHLAAAREEVELAWRNGLGTLDERQRAAVSKLVERVARRNAHLHVKDLRQLVQS